MRALARFLYPDDETAIFCEDAADQIYQSQGMMLEYALRVGQLLTQVKDKLPHGEFGPWLDVRFASSRQTATNYMNAWRAVEEHEAARKLDLDVLYLLTSGVPDDVKRQIVDCEADHETAADLIQRARVEEWKRQVEELAREDPGAAYHEIEQKGGQDSYADAARDLLIGLAPALADLSDRPEAEILAEAGIGVDGRHRGWGSSSLTYVEDAGCRRLVAWVENGNGVERPMDVALFPASDVAEHMACQNEMVRLLLDRFKPRTMDRHVQAQ